MTMREFLEPIYKSKLFWIFVILTKPIKYAFYGSILASLTI